MIHDKFKMRLYSLHQCLFTIKGLKYVYHEDTGPNSTRRQSLRQTVSPSQTPVSSQIKV